MTAAGPIAAQSTATTLHPKLET